MFSDLKPKIIIGAALLCSLVLFGMYYGYTKFLVDTPLVERVNSFEEVEMVDFDAREKVLKVKIADKTNLPEIYQQLLKEIGTTGYQLEIIDNPSEQLLNYFYRAQFIIQEAINNGNYQEMLLQLEKMAKDENIMAKFYLDEQYLYLDLVEGESELVTILSRKPILRDVSWND